MRVCSHKSSLNSRAAAQVNDTCLASVAEDSWTKAYIALGSNVGKRLENIEKAYWALFKHDSIRLRRTSLLYETAPMYVEDQDPFLNAACEIETGLSPMELLDELQSIENAMGRVKLIDKGPRNIDLDILLYGDEKVETERLIIPHRLMHEREFVLRPLADLIPNERIPFLDSSKNIHDHLVKLTPCDPPLSPIVPFGPGQYLRPLDPSRRTKLMSILNVTPDSFSDITHVLPVTETDQTKMAALRNLTIDEISSAVDSSTRGARQKLLQDDNLVQLFNKIARAVADGSDIIDIGGQSSRPGAKPVGDKEESDRVRAAMTIRALFFPSISTSVDTYRAAVADASRGFGYHFSSTTDVEAAHLEPGAHIVNDISAGQMDPDMLSCVAWNRQTIVLMHMRGTPETMSKYTDYPHGVVQGVAEELLQRVAEAEASGIPRWRIVLDPGIGFAKTSRQNLELLGRLSELRDWEGLKGIPWLVGASRKRFIGDALAQDDQVIEDRQDYITTEWEGTIESLEKRPRERKDLEAEKIAADAESSMSNTQGRWSAIVEEAKAKTKAGVRHQETDPRVRHVNLRDLGTAATVAAAVQGGADVVRVHDVRTARDVIAVADAIWRRP
ncbi:Pterin-binding enzyme-like protein [Elsinoe fawcettii]|nr:Pterin-binding enzyme-like protein [Elsinoe fawcettii]